MTRAKPTCSFPSKAPKQVEWRRARATSSRGIPAAQYEDRERNPWITSRSSRDGSVTIDRSAGRHSWSMGSFSSWVGALRRARAASDGWRTAGQGRLGDGEAPPAHELLERFLRAHGMLPHQPEDRRAAPPDQADRIYIHDRT